MKKEITEDQFFSMIRERVKDFSGYVLPNVEILRCYSNDLKVLPELPNVKVLDCSNNDLTALPELPNVEVLYCYSNDLKVLPELPNVKVLDCSNNDLTALPELPNVKVLDCYSNDFGVNYTQSATSGRCVYYYKDLNRVVTGCFTGTLEEFYEKGFKAEGKEWVKKFYELINK